jgi:hypothetical protein
MAKYYKVRPSSTLSRENGIISNNDNAMLVDQPIMSEFDKHRESLLTDDVEEGWASELRRYLGTMQRNVKKDTDLVEWWQVSN